MTTSPTGHPTVTTPVAEPGQPISSLGFVGNIVWLVVAGFELFVLYMLAALVMAVTIIGIPFAVQAVKLGVYALWPFGSSLRARRTANTGLSAVANVIWFLLPGWILAVAHLVVGVVLCLTIIFIPFGLANFKLARVALNPFGKDVVLGGLNT